MSDETVADRVIRVFANFKKVPPEERSPLVESLLAMIRQLLDRVQ